MRIVKTLFEMSLMYYGIFWIVLIGVIILFSCGRVANIANASEAEPESDCALDGTVYRRYICQVIKGDDCDPFIMHAWSDELFCQMVVFLSTGGSYTRTVPGKLCYPSGTTGGQVCMEFSPYYARAETKYSAVQDITSVYLYSRKRDNATYMPMLVKR